MDNEESTTRETFGGFKKPKNYAGQDAVSETLVVENKDVDSSASVTSKDRSVDAINNQQKLMSQSWKASVVAKENRMQLPTADELEAIRKAAYEEGFNSGKEKGFEVGHAAATKKGEQEISATIARLKQVLQALFEPIGHQDNALEKVLLDSVVSICHLVLKRELKIDSSQIIKILQEALSSLKIGHDNIKVHLHSRDAELIRENMSSFSEYSDNWQIVEHTTLSPGGCIVETESSVLNASLDTRLEQVIQQIYDQEVLKLPGNTNENHQKEIQFKSNRFSDVAEETHDNDPLLDSVDGELLPHSDKEGVIETDRSQKDSGQ